MNIAIIGTGYVGLPQGAVFANVGNYVICVDRLEERIQAIKDFCEGKAKKLPIYERGLESLVQRNYSSKSLEFTTDLKYAIGKADVVFICVGTPSAENGKVDTNYVLNAAKDIAIAAESYKVVVIKSTVPPGTAKAVKRILAEYSQGKFDVVSNPEFLAQGEAVSGSNKPDRIVIGLPEEKYFGALKGDAESIELRDRFKQLYKPFEMRGEDILFFMTNEDAEMHKYIANTYLAAQIAVTNEGANLAKAVGANWRRLSGPFKKDGRIGKFTHPSLGFGGSCFPKDVKALAHVFNDYGVQDLVIGNVIPSNENQKLSLNRALEEHFGIKGKTYSIWGLSFKAETNDTRESAAIEVISDLLKKGAKVKAYDPEAVEDIKVKLGERKGIAGLLGNIEYFSPYAGNSKYDALKGSDGLLVLTEWMEFRQPDFNEIKRLLSKPLVLDGRDLYNPKQMEELGFSYVCIGNPDVIQE